MKTRGESALIQNPRPPGPLGDGVAAGARGGGRGKRDFWRGLWYRSRPTGADYGIEAAPLGGLWYRSRPTGADHGIEAAPLGRIMLLSHVIGYTWVHLGTLYTNTVIGTGQQIMLLSAASSGTR